MLPNNSVYCNDEKNQVTQSSTVNLLISLLSKSFICFSKFVLTSSTLSSFPPKNDNIIMLSIAKSSVIILGDFKDSNKSKQLFSIFPPSNLINILSPSA